MLEFLQTGKMLYVLAAVCALGTLSKLVTGSLYKRLIRETGNMALTKDKNLKALKQRMENVFLINHGIRNVSAYIEKQLYGFRFLHVTLDGWDSLSVQAMILCFMVGGAAAFGAYWYRCDSYYIVMYGAAGVFGGLFLAFVDNGVDAAAKRKQLADNLVDYVENSPHFYRSVDNTAYSGQERKKAAGASDIVDLSGSTGYARMPESVRKEKMSSRFSVLGRKKDAQEPAGKNGMGCQEAASLVSPTRNNRAVSRAARMDGKGLTGLASKENDAAGEKSSGDSMSGMGRRTVGKMDELRAQTGNSRNGSRGRAGAQDKENDLDRTDFREVRTSEVDLAESITHLSESLRQIAASREQESMQQKEADCLELIQNSVSAEDMRVLKTLLQAFQSGT